MRKNQAVVCSVLLLAVALLPACSGRVDGGAPQDVAVLSSAGSESGLAGLRLGEECSGELSDRFNAAYYFGIVNRVDRVISDAVLAATRGASEHAGEAEVSDLLSATEAVVAWVDETAPEPERLLIGEDLIPDIERLPGGLDMLLVLRPSHLAGVAWVQFAVVVDPDSGDLVFIGLCGERFYGDKLTEYRDEVRPNQRLDDLFLSVVTNEGVWADFNDWDLGQGAYDPLALGELSPQERQIDLDGTPTDVLDALIPYVVDVTLPDGWAGLSDYPAIRRVEALMHSGDVEIWPRRRL